MKIVFFVSWFILLISININAQEIHDHTKASLCGSIQSMLKQNYEADKEGLTRIKNIAQLERLINEGALVSIQKIENVMLDYRLKDSLSYVRPVTALFLKNLGADYFRNFGLYIQVNSAVRTIDGQIELHLYNSNAAPAYGYLASSHLTGATIDISYMDMTEIQMNWMRKYLLHFESKNLIEATEEHSQTVFHIMVFQSYNNIK